ncbi:DUF2019 domain-containing protein [Archangium violaceum]|uniref:DUF2019 domain-containing protein n=1 Tax=Archangium violaceum TaxID=83451 RepID=UPI0036DC0CB0
MKKAQIKKLPTEELVEKIRILSAERWPAIHAGKPREANRMYDLLVAIEKELKARGIEAQRQMLKLLDDPDPGTRCWAAGSVLEFAPADGERVLTDIAEHVDGLVGFSAERTLEQWKAGTFNPP